MDTAATSAPGLGKSVWWRRLAFAAAGFEVPLPYVLQYSEYTGLVCFERCRPVAHPTAPCPRDRPPSHTQCAEVLHVARRALLLLAPAAQESARQRTPAVYLKP